MIMSGTDLNHAFLDLALSMKNNTIQLESPLQRSFVHKDVFMCYAEWRYEING